MRGTLMLVTLVAFLTGCGAPSAQSQLSDIYDNDAQTRHAATAEEKLWTVKANGCSASILNQEYLLTAAHCSPHEGAWYTSGSALVNGNSRDIELIEIVEHNSSMDYVIAKIKWENDQAPDDQKFPPSIATKAEDAKGGRDGEGTKLFTVGFPVDQGMSATYAEGYAKKYRGDELVFNVPIINGNSGGAVWRTEDKMLVSMTNNGPTQHGQDGWDHNDPEDPNHWNYSVAMYKAYEQSDVLKEIFPNGQNSTVDQKGNLIK